MDDADYAAILIEQEEERRRLRPSLPEFQAVGICLNCEAPLGSGHRWCSVACRDDHLARFHAERRNRDSV